MKKQSVTVTLLFGVALSPLALLAVFWTSIPETFRFSFELDRIHETVQSRNDLLIKSVIISLASAGLYWVMQNMKKVDPKVNEETPGSSFHRVGATIVIFFAVLNFYFIFSARYGWSAGRNVEFGFLGLLVAAMGNFMNSLRPNYIAGIRLPWTLNDPENWRKTHLLAGKIWFLGGILLMILSAVSPASFLVPATIVVMVVLVAIPSYYSFSIRSRNN